MAAGQQDGLDVPAFDRRFFASSELCTAIGDGAVGGKARGLLLARDVLRKLEPDPAWEIGVSIPRMIVVTTSVFDAFLDGNDLRVIAASDAPDERIAHAFQRGSLPTGVLGDLRALVEDVHTPLAVRSSSLLEDAMHRPFAGVYATKMIPNDQPDADARFQRLVEAIKFVFASCFFRAAKRYRHAADRTNREEKMAVLIQEVVGRRYGSRYYPLLSGVAKSYNFYPSGAARPEDGVVNLALGLGKTIVDGGRCWIYSPTRPAAAPPYASARELLQQTQVRFWAVHMGSPPRFDPIAEEEFLIEGGLEDADYDGVLRYVASTYDPSADRLTPGTGRAGPRALDFAPILGLREIRLNDLLRCLLERCSGALAAPTEIEFALTIDPHEPPRAHLGFLQMRPMIVSDEVVDVPEEALHRPDVVVAAQRALGNGVDETVRDIVYVKPDGFESRHTRRIAAELAEHNDRLVADHCPYLLIGFGRWGSSDPWLGIPVEWGDIAGARVMVETTLPTMDVEASQGAHFFHNLSSFQVCYLTVHHAAEPGIDWSWLESLPAVQETTFVRHVRAPAPLLVKVDGRSGRGAVWRSPASAGTGNRSETHADR
ncbi:MAG: hypothetical protein AMS20_15420 [Gemmatimonas sp. SG8_28]|nr:MAG: hypothetical protein AMS20_15420 [Gemmatimonas sp. SG8_28]